MRLLKKFVNIVLKETTNVSLVVAKHPVGLEEIVKDFEMNTFQSVEGDQGVQIVGIWGMGGSGKTTLAKELYNSRSSLMKWSSFVFDVRDAVLVEKFLEACHGLPLSLKVFGAQLYGELHKQCWKTLLHEIMRILPHDIKEKLKVSYDTLDDEEKEAFLDIAYFFIGERNSLAIEVWNGSGMEWSL
ncbi:hypothetical protein SUGI_0675270 [Cryptomeria japonica]|nr:hypothetical protein SUGI_0675270 [Cryptomeria japonica]